MFLLGIVGVALYTSAAAQTVSEKDGTILLTTASGHTRRLTSVGRASHPTLSPNRKWVAFVRTVSGPPIHTGLGDVDPQEIWIIAVDGRNAKRLASSLRPRDPRDPSQRAELSNLQFSIDGRALYFMSSCSVVSACLHRVEVRTRRVRVITAANSLEVLREGRHAGYLIVTKHTYFPEGGSYEAFWLLTPEGEAVQDLGEGNPDSAFDDTIRRFKMTDALPGKHPSKAAPTD